ncbi:MAG: hypothetical protein AB8I08_16530 [Sandaracinaceae bacterium]
MDAFWGDRSTLRALDGLKCKGNWLASRPRYVRETWGEGMFSRVAEALEPRERQYFEKPPLPFGWHPFRSLCRIDEQIFELAMRRDLESMRTFGGAMTDYDLNVVYRTFFRLGTPEFLLSKTHLLWRQYASGGRLKPTVTKGAAAIEFTEVAVPRYLCAYGICGYLTAATVAAGGTRVRVEHASCVHAGDAACRYEVRWE